MFEVVTIGRLSFFMPLVGCLGQTQDSLVLRSKKTPRSLALSVAGREAAYRLTRSNLWGEWKTLVFPLGAALDSLLRRYFALALSYFANYTLQLTYHTLFYTDQRTSFADYSESTLNCLLARHSDTSHIHSFT